MDEEEDEIFEDARGLISTTDAQDMEADMKRQEKHERERKLFASVNINKMN